MRYSKQREAVYGVLCATNTHPDVSYIYSETRKILPNISLGTVYRNLEELCSDGRARKIGVEGSVERFDGDISPHAHFVCTCCGKVYDVPAPKVDDIICDCGKAERAEVMFYGMCNECLKKN